MSSPDADERGTRNYNKRIDQCTLHFDFSFVVTSAALGRPSRNSEDRIFWRVGRRPANFAGHFLNIAAGEPPSPSHLRPFPDPFASPPSHLRVIPTRHPCVCRCSDSVPSTPRVPHPSQHHREGRGRKESCHPERRRSRSRRTCGLSGGRHSGPLFGSESPYLPFVIHPSAPRVPHPSQHHREGGDVTGPSTT